MDLGFKTKKLGTYLQRVNTRVKNLTEPHKLTVYGVSKEEGVTITGKEASDNLSDYIAVKGQAFVYNPYRINIGSIGLTDESFEGVVSPAYVVFRTTKDILPEFLFNYLKSSIGLFLINWYGNRGGVRNALGFDDLAKIDFPEINRKKQETIFQKIEKINVRYSSLLSEFNIQSNLLIKLRQSILQDAVQGKLVPQDPNDEPASELLKRIKAEKEKLIKAKKTKKEYETHQKSKEIPPFDIPFNWTWVRLWDVAWCYRGHNPPKSEFKNELVEGYTRFIQITDFKTDTKAVFVPISKKLKMVKKGEILMAAYRHIGKLSRDVEGAFNVALCKVNNIDPFNRDYLELLIKSDLITKELLDASERGHIPSMHSEHLLGLWVAIPPEKEQIRILLRYNQLNYLINQLESRVTQSQKEAELLLQTVLREAFV